MFFDNIKTENQVDLNQFGVIECTEENVQVAMYQIALENEQNFQNIHNAIMNHSFNCLCECEGYVTEAEQESKVKKILNAIKEAIQRFWAKIKGVFKQIKSHIELSIRNNQKLVMKLKDINSKPIKIDDSKKKIKGYSFESLDGKLDIYKKTAEYLSTLSPTISIQTGKFDMDIEGNEAHIKGGINRSTDSYVNPDLAYRDEINRIKGILVNDNNFRSYSAENFQDDLKKLFYGEEKEIDITKVERNALISEIENAKKTNEELSSAYVLSSDTISKYLNELKAISKAAHGKYSADNNFKKALSIYSSLVSQSISAMSQTLSVHTSAIVARYKQNVRIAHILINHDEN